MRNAGDHAHRQGRRGGPHRRPGDRRRRLPAASRAIRANWWPASARCCAAARRADGRRAAGRQAAVRFGRFSFDPATRQLLDDGTLVKLTSGEFAVLAALVAHPFQTLSRERLMSLARGRDHEAFERSIDVDGRRACAAAGRRPAQPRWLQTVWGEGYVFVPHGEHRMKRDTRARSSLAGIGARPGACRRDPGAVAGGNWRCAPAAAQLLRTVGCPGRRHRDSRRQRCRSDPTRDRSDPAPKRPLGSAIVSGPAAGDGRVRRPVRRRSSNGAPGHSGRRPSAVVVRPGPRRRRALAARDTHPTLWVAFAYEDARAGGPSLL